MSDREERLEMRESRRPDVDQGSDADRKPYEPPTLVRYGRVEDLTGGTSGPITDFMGGQQLQQLS